MRPSNIILLALTFGVGSYAAPVDETTHLNVTMDPHLQIVGNPIDMGTIEDTEIPELLNISTYSKGGEMLYDIPEDGIDISTELYEKLSGRAVRHLDKRSCDNYCNCGTDREYDLVRANWWKYTGITRIESSVACGPAVIGKSYTVTKSYTISGSLDPGFLLANAKILLERVTLKVGFQYSWGNSVATAYNIGCPNEHPCVLLFTPAVGVITGMVKYVELSKYGRKLCRSGILGYAEIHVPETERRCGKEECAAKGTWDRCYITGPRARALCSNIGASPPAGSVCPPGV